jgi:hypothetical protein
MNRNFHPFHAQGGEFFQIISKFEKVPVHPRFIDLKPGNHQIPPISFAAIISSRPWNMGQ